MWVTSSHCKQLLFYDMKIILYLLIHLILIFTYHTGSTQNDIKSSISQSRIKEYVDFLASDELNGRGIGSPELTKAAHYIQEQLIKLNVKKPPSGYLQPFTLTRISADKTNSTITVSNKKGRTKKQTNQFVALNQTKDTVTINGEFIFAGFGPSLNSEGNTSQTLPDINGKIVLYSAGSPQLYLNKASGEWNNPLEQKKIEALFRSGAKALILVTSPEDTENITYRHFENLSERQKYSLPNKSSDNSRAIFIVHPQTAEKLMRGSFNWSKALAKAAHQNDESFISVDNKNIIIQSILNREAVPAMNVAGYLEGSDSILKHEHVVFISHYDHLGRNEDGEIFNGADDNASGVAAVLETAGLFSYTEQKPRRSIVFLFPSAEEVGLLGSGYYSQNPVFPLENTVACINLDMVGRVSEPRDSVWANSPKPAKDFNGIYVLANKFDPTLKTIADSTCRQLELVPDHSLPERFFYSSDHYHFHKNKVPVLNFSTGYTADYHKITDTSDRIRTDKIQRVVQLCYLVGMELASKDSSQNYLQEKK